MWGGVSLIIQTVLKKTLAPGFSFALPVSPFFSFRLSSIKQWLSGKDPPAMQEMWVRSLGQEIPWRRKWQPTPVWRIPRTEEPRGLQTMGEQKSQIQLSDSTTIKQYQSDCEPQKLHSQSSSRG